MVKTNYYLKFLLAASILLNLLLGYKYITNKYKYNPDYTFNRKELFEHLPTDSNSIVFLGNSLTQQFELAELFNTSTIRNRGINGEMSSGLLTRLDNITHVAPKKIFLEIGINDLKLGVENDVLLNNYKAILAKLQKECKTTVIYVQSLLPVYAAGPMVKNSSLNNKDIETVNEALLRYCKDRGITYINLYDHFVYKGEMNPKYCIADGLHISGEGYLLWAKILRQYVAE